MRLNTLKPAKGAKPSKTRVGRGIGSGKGKTSGRGHKGQKARSGGGTIRGFEGGQMPLQRRLPKIGFKSRKSIYTTEIRLDELEKLAVETVDLLTLKKAGLIQSHIKFVKIILAGELKKEVIIKNSVQVTKGAQAMIEKAGGKVEK